MPGSPSWPAGVVQHIKASRSTPVLVSDVLPSICVIPAGHVAVRPSVQHSSSWARALIIEAVRIAAEVKKRHIVNVCFIQY